MSKMENWSAKDLGNIKIYSSSTSKFEFVKSDQTHPDHVKVNLSLPDGSRVSSYIPKEVFVSLVEK